MSTFAISQTSPHCGSLSTSALPAMECKIFKATDDYADEEIIIRDPYVFPRQHPVRSVALGGAAAVSLVFAFVLWSRCCPPMKEDRLKLKLCFWYQCLAAFGSLLEVAATAFLSENDALRAKCTYLIFPTFSVYFCLLSCNTCILTEEYPFGMSSR